MIIITGTKYEAVLEEVNHRKILFPEYGKNRALLKEFVRSLKGDEIIVTASLELMDLLLMNFRGNENLVVYSNTGEALTFNEAYGLRKYLDFDLRGGKSGESSKVSVLFVEGKTDSKFFKAAYKKVFGFKESRSKGIPENLKLMERLFERDNYELIVKDDSYIAIIPSEGNSGVIRNLGNFLRAMEVFAFMVNKIGLAIDIDDGREHVMESITGKLSLFKYKKSGDRFIVGDTTIIPLLIGAKIELNPCVEWQKPAVEDFMLAVLQADGTLEKIERAINILCIDLKRKLKPKEVIYLAMAAKKFWGNLEGFYEMMIMRTPRWKMERILKKGGIYDKMREVVP
ncbi:DUF3226 domain-containing protein [Thermococcus sp.]